MPHPCECMEECMFRNDRETNTNNHFMLSSRHNIFVRPLCGKEKLNITNTFHAINSCKSTVLVFMENITQSRGIFGQIIRVDL